MAVKPIPEGYHSLTPSMGLKGADKAIEFFKRAFGAKELMHFPGPGGKVMHCEMQIGDSRFMFGEADAQPVMNMHVMLYVEDCDAAYKRAVDAGATPVDPPKDQFYGDRTARVTDPFGNNWYFATHVEDVSEGEMNRRFQEMMKKGGPGGG